jgi:hypothetical protein
MADGIQDIYATSGWEALKQLFRDNGMAELADTIADSLKENGENNDSLVYEDLRKSDQYKTRFKGNFDRLAAGKNFLSEGTYIQQENSYASILGNNGAAGLANRDNYSKFIANDVSVDELENRFTLAYDRVTKAVNTQDKTLLDELRKMYPGINDNELATSLLLGKEGSKFLNNRINIAEIKASEAEVGIKSTIGAEALAGKVGREGVKAGLEKTAAQKTGYENASKMFGEQDVEGIQNQLEQENILGITSRRTKRLASQARAQYSGQSGISTGSLSKKKQV